MVWANVAATVTAALARGDFLIDARRARERTQLLVKHYKSNNRAQLKKSGTEEDYTEKEMLLSEICALIRDSEEHIADVQQRKTDKAVRDRVVGMAIRDAAMARLATMKNGQVADTRAADAVPNEDQDESFGDGETEERDATDRDADSGDTPEKEEEIQQRPKRRRITRNKEEMPASAMLEYMVKKNTNMEEELRINAQRLQLDREKFELDGGETGETETRTG
ncbi:hypothetical protein LSAT2_013817 [Lamellibrachia satsuma]|nr:hypothetical protein LSAT2_013817 [Lamellibrachia satsuma]